MSIILIIGIVIMTIILILMIAMAKASEKIHIEKKMPMTIDKQLFDNCLQIKNKGKSIDSIIGILIECDIKPEFHIDINQN